MTDSLREIVHRFLGSCVWQCREAHTEDCDALVKAIHSHTQALVAAAYAACAEHIPMFKNYGSFCRCSCGWATENEGHTLWRAHIRSLTPADAVRELERRDESVRADTIMRFRKVLDRLDIHGYYNEMQREFGCEEASLSNPAPVERSNENG